MRFICAACGKTLDLEGEEARFCPFCGRAYAAAVMDGARADAVQAKYWQMTRAAYGAALRDMADFQGRQSPKKGFRLERLTGATSKKQAQQEIERCLAMLAKRLDAEGVSHFTLQGSTPKPVRAELVRRFNAGEASVFLISLRAGGTGLNLTAADIVIHYDPWWNVAAQNQATDRAYRIGQRNPVQVYRLIAQDTIEEKIVELQQAKQSLADTVTGGADGAILSMNPEQLLQLLGEEA